MLLSRTRALVAATVAIGALSAAANAALVVVSTPVGATTGGQPVWAEATFTTSAGQVNVFLENKLANPASVVQGISGLSFTLDGGQTGGSLLSSSGMERNVASNGTYTDVGLAASGWSFTNLPPAVLNVLGTPTAPEHVIIGPPDGSNVYSAANGSIKGNGPHNPFFGQSATFVMSIPGVTADTKVTGVTFQFNTSPGNTVTVNVPEPMSLGLAAMAAAVPMLRRRRA